jgi:uncharacterized protein
MTALDFTTHPERLAIVRLDDGAALPDWALRLLATEGAFVTVSRTPGELSVVAAEHHVPAELPQARGKVAFGIVGVVPMTTVGLLASLCSALALRSVPVFVVSTHDTDWLLVDAERAVEARAALTALGHRVAGAVP